MKKIIVPVLLALIIGFLYGRFMLNQYDNKESLISVFSNSKFYFLQAGAYSSKEAMEKSLTNETYYIYSNVDNMYYVYLGITQNEKNSLKLKGYFNNLGYDIYVKEFSIDNISFKTILEQYDALLEQTEDEKAIKAITTQVLAKYEELVLTE